MGKRACADCGRTAAVAQRVLVSSNFLCAICLLVFGCTVERPINSFPPIAMILLSFLSLASAITGLVGGHKWACCLDAHLALLSIDTLCKMILVIVLWTNFGSVVDAIDPHATGYDRGRVTQVLGAAKWLLLLFLLCEAVALVLSILLRYVLDPPSAANRYNNFDESKMQERALNMQSLKSDVESAQCSTTKTSTYKNVMSKMQSKYGAFSQGVKWKKGWW